MPGTRRSDVWRQELTSHSSKESEFALPPPFSVQASKDWMMSSILVRVIVTQFVDSPSQTHPEMMFSSSVLNPVQLTHEINHHRRQYLNELV